MTTVLVVGMAVVDFLFEVDVMPCAAEKYQAHDAVIVGGGGAANAACAVARLGGHALLAARIGDDMMGNMIIDDLAHHAVDCSKVVVTEGARSSYSSVFVDASGERQIVNFRGSGLSDDTSRIESTRPAAVLTDTRWTSGAVAAMRLAKQNGIPGVVDAEAPMEPLILELASHIAFSRQGLESIAGTLNSIENIASALSEASDRYNAWVAMTDGGNGVYIWNSGKLCHYAAMSIEVVDTLGAGDVWHGAFAYRLACGDNEGDAVKYASIAATLKCARSGGGRSCPRPDELDQWL